MSAPVSGASKLPRAIVFVAGLVVLGIGAATLFAPTVFHGANGIDFGGDASMLSEARAAGSGLLAIGALITLGAFVARLAVAAAATGTVVYLAYGLSRVLSIVVDGMPANGLVVATVAELALGLACALALARHRRDGGRAGPA